MKVEKISNIKVKITLSFEELIERNISLTDLVKDSSKIQQVFFNIFDETDLDEDFLQEDSQLLVEATTSNDNLFIITVTKLIDDIIPNINSFIPKSKNIKTTYKVSSNIYSFNTLDKIMDFAKKALKENLYLGLNSIYKYNNLYYVIFKSTTVANKKFLKTFIVLSEFCDKYYSNNIYQAALLEKSQCILKNRALQKLSNI